MEVETSQVVEIPRGQVSDSFFSSTEKFIAINKYIARDLNDVRTSSALYRHTKKQVMDFLQDPRKHQKGLRNAVRFVYNSSPHFRRLIHYFTGLSDFSYIVSPYKIDTKKANVNRTNLNYRKVLNLLSSMNVRTQLPKILTVCLREDIFFGTFREGADSIIIQQLPSDWCAITTIENNVANVTFDFSYFDIRHEMFEFFPEEFRYKYENIYKKDTTKRWIELDAPKSFAVKASADMFDYPVPPFAGILREIFDLEDYRELKLAKTLIENYALLVMKIPMDDEGKWLIDGKKAEDFWSNLDAVMPEEVGSILSPMDIEKISFEKSNTGDADTIAEAEQNLFTAAGVSSLLFNNERASANALLLSIKADQSMTFGIVKNIEDVINRYIQYQNYGKNFKVTFLDVSPFNRKEMGDAYIKAASYGLPTISAYAASQGISQAELDAMSFLENDVLKLHELFKPLVNSSQMSVSDDVDAEESTGRPPVEDEDLSDSGEESREDRDDWG